MDQKLTRHLAREFGCRLASAVASDPWATRIRECAQDEHKAAGQDVETLLTRFLLEHGIADEGVVDWEGKKRSRGVLQQQSYALLGTWTHPDLAVVAPFTCAVEFDREDDTWAGYKQSLMKAACHVLSGAYDAVVHVFTLTYADSSASIYLQDAGPTTFTGNQPNASTRQLLATLQAYGVVTAFVPAGRGARVGAPREEGK